MGSNITHSLLTKIAMSFQDLRLLRRLVHVTIVRSFKFELACDVTELRGEHYIPEETAKHALWGMLGKSDSGTSGLSESL